MVDISHRLGIKAQASVVYRALSTIEGLAGWWTEETSGQSRVGGEIAFIFRSETGDIKGRMVMKVLALETDRAVRWSCIEGPEEWLGTELHFELSQADDYTIVLFGHRKWREAGEFMSHCSMKWASFLLSLRDLILRGQGLPSPHDIKIDNWN